MTGLELLAPAGNANIGIAAIDCGADAVYIAGPAYGARFDAANSVGDIRRLCDYAHRYAARVYIALNTLVYDDELEEVRRLIEELKEAGADAFIIQDPAVFRMTEGLERHASTQCTLLTPQRARLLEGMGYDRLVLERQLSLKEIRAIREAVSCQLEAFIHGALCTSFSGNCYLSEYLGGRSANRGRCMQACRSRYTLRDGDGKVILRDKALLSLKDLCLSGHLEELALAGVCSFKIEGRLKGESYVRNLCLHYARELDRVVAAYPDRFRRSSLGRAGRATEVADPEKSFNRRYTTMFFDGRKTREWSSMEAPKWLGEPVGSVRRIVGTDIEWEGTVRLHKGDGLSFLTPDGQMAGFRIEDLQGRRICLRTQTAREVLPQLRPRTPLYRNLDAEFERRLKEAATERVIPLQAVASLRQTGPEAWSLHVRASAGNGPTAERTFAFTAPVAENRERMAALFPAQWERRSGIFSFSFSWEGESPTGPDTKPQDAPDSSGAPALMEMPGTPATLPLLSASTLNAQRRALAEDMEKAIEKFRENASVQKVTPANAAHGTGLPEPQTTLPEAVPEHPDYRYNIANHLSRETWNALGARETDPAYELAHPRGAELMRTRYCIRFELGICPFRDWMADAPPASGKDSRDPRHAAPLFLENNRRLLRAEFDCARCEMVIKENKTDSF